MNLEMLSSPYKIEEKILPNRIVNQPMECFVKSLTINYENPTRKNRLKISEETTPGLEKLV